MNVYFLFEKIKELYFSQPCLQVVREEKYVYFIIRVCVLFAHRVKGAGSARAKEDH